MNIILKILSNIKSWFCNIDIKNLSLFNKTYQNQLFIVVDTIEKLEKMSSKGSERAISQQLKKVISNRMKNNGLDRKFDLFLRQHEIMKG